MTGPVHDRAQLGAYALGALDPVEARQVHEHLTTCVDCQREVNELMMIRRALDQVPPEAFVDGPPENGDLLLRRTLRQVRTETPEAPRRRLSAGFAVAAAVAVAVALGGGVLLGRETVSTPVAQSPTSTLPSNARLAAATDPGTGTSMNIAMEPRKGWVWVNANVRGLAAGLHCEMYVVAENGEEILAGGWLVSEEGSANGTDLEGTALIEPDQVRAIEIRTQDGQTMVSVPL
ncbi:anti-sigma factor family protein [Actinophytocola glycyrrhizae]|uniref:Anti-sigma factor family protein n=1 Tax=Actinophytocola glycyrrhizae TaxID=2044873 RepID=A0ABV9S0D5_9PSEU